MAKIKKQKSLAGFKTVGLNPQKLTQTEEPEFLSYDAQCYVAPAFRARHMARGFKEAENKIQNLKIEGEK